MFLSLSCAVIGGQVLCLEFLFEFVKIEVLFIASTRLFFIAKQRSTTSQEGGRGEVVSTPLLNFAN